MKSIVSILFVLATALLLTSPTQAGYADGMNQYAAYHVMHGGVDPRGLNAERTKPLDPMNVQGNPDDPLIGFDVNDQMTQRMTQPFNATHKWDVDYSMFVRPATCDAYITLLVKFTETQELKDKFPGRFNNALLARWEANVEQTWSDRAKIVCPCDEKCPDGYRILVDFNITNDDKVADQSVSVKVGATRNMGKWGIGDTTGRAAAHEVGHMLGNKDEYGVVDGKNWGMGENVVQKTVMSGSVHINDKGEEVGYGPDLRHYGHILDSFNDAYSGNTGADCFLMAK